MSPHLATATASSTLAAMDREPSPALLAAIEAGRGQRGRCSRQGWSRHRARILSAVQAGLPLVRVAGALGVNA